jgi:hypothetical protein
MVDQDAHPPHHLPNRSRCGSGTACHDRQALVPPWTPLAHALAHSRSDGHQAQPEGLETIPSRSAQGLHLPREARSRLERLVEASIGHVSRLAGCHMPGSDLFGRHGSGSNFYSRVCVYRMCTPLIISLPRLRLRKPRAEHG